MKTHNPVSFRALASDACLALSFCGVAFIVLLLALDASAPANHFWFGAGAAFGGAIGRVVLGGEGYKR